ncbi:ABC transporter permease, partial [Acinetobacter baumannii]|uniref:ABC transporter permease n=1 Tax=Acinetobacter baumannii TaxID=470 RepID=UPI00189C0CF5
FVTWIVSGAMVFALVIQLKQALQSKSEFRMDMLFPIKEGQREKAIRQLLIYLIVAQAVIVTLCNVMMPQLYVTPIVILLVGFITLKLSK